MIYCHFGLCRSFVRYFFLILLIILNFACSADENRYDLYSMPGFDPGTRPNMRNQSLNNGIRFEEFYQQDPNAAIQEQIITDRIRNNNYRQDFIDSNMVPNYSQQNIPNSRFYANPYEFNQPNPYQSRDIEQFYVPPNYYQNIERSYSVPQNINIQRR